MKKKIFTFLIFAIMMSVNAYSQTIKENLDKLSKDKSTRDRADKADVLIHKKTILDTTQTMQTTTTPVKVVSKTAGVNKVKHKKHKHKLKLKKASK